MIKELSLSIGQLLGISTTIATLIAICICAVWSIIFNRIKEVQKAEFQKQIEEQKSEFAKEIENLKAKNEKLNYITKTQFEAEFKMYQELSEASFTMLIDMFDFFPYWLKKEERKADIKIKRLEKINRAKQSHFIFQNLLYKYASFINKDLYSQFNELRNNCKIQIEACEKIDLKEDENFTNNYIEITDINCNKSREIENYHLRIVENLRIYLESLKVLED